MIYTQHINITANALSKFKIDLSTYLVRIVNNSKCCFCQIEAVLVNTIILKYLNLLDVS